MRVDPQETFLRRGDTLKRSTQVGSARPTMKLFYAPQSPFARKVRAAAIELGLNERIQLEYAEVVPGQPNADYAQSRNPLRKIPALVTDAGETIFDSTVICEYLECYGGRWNFDPSRSITSLARADESLSRPRNV